MLTAFRDNEYDENACVENAPQNDAQDAIPQIERLARGGLVLERFGGRKIGHGVVP
jgi:hypothetical protein